MGNNEAVYFCLIAFHRLQEDLLSTMESNLKKDHIDEKTFEKIMKKVHENISCAETTIQSYLQDYNLKPYLLIYDWLSKDKNGLWKKGEKELIHAKDILHAKKLLEERVGSKWNNVQEIKVTEISLAENKVNLG
jgi:hypothetical protein